MKATPAYFGKTISTYQLAKENSKNGIDALIKVHEQYAGGTTSVLYVDDDLYIMQRNGSGNQEGLIFVLNNRGELWNGRAVQQNGETLNSFLQLGEPTQTIFKLLWNNGHRTMVGENSMPRQEDTQSTYLNTLKDKLIRND